jgi:hypothetical protein
MQEEEQGGMVPNETMLTVTVDGERESNNLIHTLTHACHGLMQKKPHFFEKVANVLMLCEKAVASQIIGYYSMLCCK